MSWHKIRKAAKRYGFEITNCDEHISDNYAPPSHQTTHEDILPTTKFVDTTEEPSINIDDVKHESDHLLPAEEPFTYLQGLNSDNLIQFSQQSVLTELMLKEMKPNLDVLPTFEEHDIGGYKFMLNLSPERKGKLNWIYSESLNKVYLRRDELFSIDAVYMPKMPMQQLRIRILLCFVKEVSEPVVRCQNHISIDNEPNEKRRLSLVRCENPSAEYCGSEEGKSINDRYSVVLPLGMSSMPKDDNTVKQTIALRFMCQNSCIGRRETSLIFLLESMNGEILSQRVVDVKVCSAPKRDKSLDEKHIERTKRKMEDDSYQREAKLRKTDAALGTQPTIKLETESRDSPDSIVDDNAPKQFDIQRTPSGGFRLVMELCSKDVLVRGIETVCDKVAGKILNEPNHAARYRGNHRQLKKLYEKALKM